MNGRARVAFHAAVATAAASSALGAVFRGYGWVVPVIAVVFIVFAASELMRRVPFPSALAPIVVAAAVTCYVTALDTSTSAYARFIPSGASLQSLHALARSGMRDVRRLATPVPTHRGLVLVAVIGVAALALVVDLLAVTMRRAALAGLPLLALFALCTSIAKHGTGWVPFALGSAGFLWLLLADSRERVARWGRSLGFERENRPRFTWSDDEVVPSPLSVLGRRIGVAAIAIGVVVPVVVPGLRGGVPKAGGHGGGRGSSSIETINPIVTITADLTSSTTQPVLVMRSSAAQPPYLRLTSLDRFDGTTFSPSPLSAPATARIDNGLPPPIPEGTTVTTSVTVRDLDVHWLPLPAQAAKVDAPGDWRFDPGSNTVFSSRSDTRRIHYTAVSIVPNPSARDLFGAATGDLSVQRYLQLPALPQSIRSLTTTVTAKASTPFERAVAIQHFLTSPPFRYDTTVAPTDSTDALDEFLRVTHAGFCQQYAAAMAVMARIVGIPSRVAVGFTRGVRQRDGSWLVTTHDAHAWPELYFSGFGWLPFEPTPRGDGQATAPSFTQSVGAGPARNPGSSPGAGNGAGRTPSALKSKNEWLTDYNQGREPDAKGPAAHPAGPAGRVRTVAPAVALALLALAAVAPATGRFVTRRRRWRRAGIDTDPADAAWAELRAAAIDARASWLDGLTPQATGRVLRAEAPGMTPTAVAALERVVGAVQRAWYARNPGAGSVASLRSDVDTVAAALRADASPLQRLVMSLWPRSTVRSARLAMARLGDVLDAADLAGARLRAKLRPRVAL